MLLLTLSTQTNGAHTRTTNVILSPSGQRELDSLERKQKRALDCSVCETRVAAGVLLTLSGDMRPRAAFQYLLTIGTETGSSSHTSSQDKHAQSALDSHLFL